ncbi:B12-binding domain-containing radical SAM protein [Desulfocurvibacter africanus]|uniref:B12-binding domain-containing radical SAM protein n=1 Tax=Desulfocurvibacter africanus TaxID=873 RepID=UPI0006879C47|nr:radical SAM protein [Desulfocurvibacter africanus]
MERAIAGPEIASGWSKQYRESHAQPDNPPYQSADELADHATHVFNRALYSPLAGLLAVAALIPRERYEVVLTDENIEGIDFDMKVDLVGISAMTAYALRGYEIADEFRRRGVPVVMGGVHPSLMARKALEHADAVVMGEAELVMDRLLDDLDAGSMRGIYKADRLCTMGDMPMLRYDLVKSNRYVNHAFIQTARGCKQGCTFCAESLMNGQRVRPRPIDDVLREIDACGQRRIALNDADFFGSREHPKKLMNALRGRGVRWQAGVTSRRAGDDEMLALAAESGCYMMRIGFESISPRTLKSVNKGINQPESYARLVEKIHSHGIMVFGLSMFGFDTDDESVFEATVRFNIEADFDMCAFSVLTPYPGTLPWYELKRTGRIVSYDWSKYDQAHVVYKPAGMMAETLRDEHRSSFRRFYSWPSLASRFPLRDGRSRSQWAIYNMFMKKASSNDRKRHVAVPTTPTQHAPMPPLMPLRREWREAILDEASDEAN